MSEKPLHVFFFGCIYVFLLLSSAFSQTIIDIRYEGLTKSSEKFLERQIKSRVGEKMDLQKIQLDAQQIQNLSMISTASYRIDSLNGSYTLIFEIDEALTLFPILNFGGIKNNVWFELGFKELNLAGLGQELTVVYRNNDRRHNGNLFYKIPFIGRSQWGASVSFLRWASIEPLYFGDETVFYDYDNTNIALSALRRLSSKQNLEIGASYFLEKYEKNERHIGEITPGPERERLPKLLFKVVYGINNVSYHNLYQTGWDNVINAQRIWNITEESTFDIVLNDTRYFKQIGKRNNLAARLRLGVSTNNDSPFAPFVLDSHVNIRGIGNRIDRGTAVAVLNLEYRQILYELDRFAFQAVAFSDFGTWRQPGGKLDDLTDSNNLVYFAGGGLRLIYKRAFNAVLRMDYGVGLINGRGNGLVLGLGQYF